MNKLMEMQSLIRRSMVVAALSMLVGIGTNLPARANLAYVTILANDHADDQIVVLDTSTNAIVTTIPGGVQPFAVGITPNGSRVYVANRGSNDVSVVDTATNTIVATVSLATTVPQGVAVTPDGAFVYVTGDRLFRSLTQRQTRS